MQVLANHRQSDQAYASLRELIVTVQLEPDSLLAESEMMARLGVGRTPLREALQRLASEHLVRSVAHRGYFVAGVTYLGAIHSYEVRQVLEGFGARLAAERASEEQKDQLRALLQEAEAGMQSDDWRWHLDVDQRFHQFVAEASGNPYIPRTLRELWSVSVRELYLSQRPITFVRDEIDVFRQTVGAICRSQPEAAEESMRQHLDLDSYRTAVITDSAGRSARGDRPRS
jgi:DNA-binding GntR family transcriptional regulator